MPKTEVNSTLSAIRRAAVAKRWSGHEPVRSRQIRVSAKALEALSRVPGADWSTKILYLIDPPRNNKPPAIAPLEGF